MSATTTLCPGLSELVARLDSAVEAETTEQITARVKAELEDFLGRAALTLPDRFRVTRADSYARLHDHGGLWCVEGVVEGEMTVTQYDVQPEADGFRVRALGAPLSAGVGTAGRLIPPTDYHVLANAQPDITSITLHVYGGNLEGCRIFTPRDDGRYQQSIRALTYQD